MDKEKYYGYLCLMRPPMPGAIPRDGIIHVGFDEGESTKSGHHYWGYAVYNHELSIEEQNHYDLEPTEIISMS